MSKVEQIQTEIEKLKLTPQEMEEIRDWLEDFIEDHLELSDECKTSIERGKRDIAQGRVRIRKPGNT